MALAIPLISNCVKCSRDWNRGAYKEKASMEPAQRDPRMADTKDKARRNWACRRRFGSGEASKIEVCELAGPKVEAEGDRNSGASAPSDSGWEAMMLKVGSSLW
jgi:hypothetical protein